VAVLEYRIDARHPAGRELAIELVVVPTAVPAHAHGECSELELFLPTWTPGSYLIREFARHLGRVQASDAASGDALACEKVGKNRVRIRLRAAARPVRVVWTVYAHDLSVRTADLTAEHAYWNHACLLLWPAGGEAMSARLSIAFPATWEHACALPQEGSVGAEPGGHRHVTLIARDLEHAMDSPCLLGRFRRLQWTVAGVPHEAALDGLGPIEPPARLVADLSAIVEQAARVFDGNLPYASYLFLCLFAADGNGGLEHGESTTLLMSRAGFASERGYREWLSLAAHEHFHAWNVKRLRPVEFWRYDYENENYTTFLWLIEGWTAYYDDVLCLRAGLFSRAQYLEALAKNINAMLGAPGRLRSSLRESSFDAWIRLYRPDENTRNSSQNYYANGAVAALCFDLWIRFESGGVRSLDDVVRGLYDATFRQGRGYRADDVRDAVHAVAGERANRHLESLIGGPLDPRLQEVFAPFGIVVKNRDADRAYLGVHFEVGSTIVASVVRDSPAFAAGLHPADEILAVQGLRVSSGTWSDLWSATAKIRQPLAILFARRGIVCTCEVVPQAAPGTIALELDEAATAEQRALLDGWLREAAPATANGVKSA
jgi:predicted metalloprotease with PDZ domain